jgi:acyl-CoA synthetase (AMP-forming)/AMP-acid ligase II
MMSQQARPSSEGCSTLVGHLRRRGSEDPDRAIFTFLTDADTEKGTLTYRALDGRARAIAGALQALGLAGERALLLYPPGLEYITAVFGCLYAGVVAVPAYPPRRNRSLDRLQAIAADARAAAALTTPAVDAALRELSVQAPELRALRRVVTDQVPADAADAWQQPPLSGDSLALLQYTSGSTATPKGVMLSHANLLHNCRSIRHCFGQAAENRGLVWLPPYHDMGLIGGILEPVYLGAHCYLMSPVTFFASPFSWLQAVSRYRATTSGGPNFAYDLCVRKVTPAQRATLDLSCWRLAFSGAEPVRAETLARFAEAFAPCGFRREAFYTCYGLAEATLLATAGKRGRTLPILSVRKAALEAHRAEPAGPGEPGARLLVGCGECVPDQRIVVVHPEKLNRCSPDEVGEIWIAGPSIAHGYWGRPEESRRTFEARFADTGEGPFLRTGDLGFVRDGELFITGRLKDLIILHGRNLYPQDLEWTAERSHPDLQPGCGAAFSVEEDDQERLVIAYEFAPRRRPDVAAVAGAVRRAIADEHGADLHALVLLRPGGVPRTSSGKVRRRDCRAAFLAGTLDAVGDWRATGRQSGAALSRAAILALAPHERQALLETYFRDQLARVLRLAPTALDLHQPINTLGLDSLTTLELKNSLEGGLEVTLAVSDFLEGANTARLVSQVLEQLPAPVPGA